MRQTIRLDSDWFFHKGELQYTHSSIKKYAYLSAKAERLHMGPGAVEYVPDYKGCLYNIYTPEEWRRVDLPHDYIIEGLPDEKYNQAWGFFDYQPAWYLKYLEIGEEYRDKRITLFFEGVAVQCTVYINGSPVARSFTGYTPFEADITDFVRIGEKNVIAVSVSTDTHEGWWYEGGGIYRHVDMIITEKVSVDLWGVYAKPVCLDEEKNEWSLRLETTVRNDGYKDEKYTVSNELLDKEGKVIAEITSQDGCERKDKSVICQEIKKIYPERWSPETPVLYTVRTKIIDEAGSVIDEYKTRFGFRTFYVDPEKGLFVNGVRTKIKGMCGHADCGLMGKAVPDNIHRYKARLMKEMGVNGYRTSHYQQANVLMDQLDELGFIVFDEARWFDSSPEGLHETEMLVKRDRNRPSVFFWGIGNEEPFHTTEYGKRIFNSLKTFILKLDDTRLITAAVNRPLTSTVYEDCDVIGINYKWDTYDEVREKYPDKPFLASECCATGTSRGWYEDEDTVRALIPAKDHSTNANYKNREYTWKFVAERDWIIGCYQWIAFEHRGEAVWPRLCSQSGAIDLFLQKKDAFYQNKSHFSSEPTVHLLPHWNFCGQEGRVINVTAYTNQSSLELFLNGNSLGRLEIEKYGHGEWNVPFEKGTLEVKAYDEQGKITCTDKRVTSGPAFALKLIQDTYDISLNGQDIAVFTCLCVDKDGNEVPDAEPFVSFVANGPCSVYSTGSDITDHTSIFLPDRKMARGRISIAVKMGEISEENAKTPVLVARSNGLVSAYKEIKTI